AAHIARLAAADEALRRAVLIDAATEALKPVDYTRPPKAEHSKLSQTGHAILDVVEQRIEACLLKIKQAPTLATLDFAEDELIRVQVVFDSVKQIVASSRILSQGLSHCALELGGSVSNERGSTERDAVIVFSGPNGISCGAWSAVLAIIMNTASNNDTMMKFIESRCLVAGIDSKQQMHGCALLEGIGIESKSDSAKAIAAGFNYQDDVNAGVSRDDVEAAPEEEEVYSESSPTVDASENFQRAVQKASHPLKLLHKLLDDSQLPTTQMSATHTPMFSTTHAIFRGLQEELRDILRALPPSTSPRLIQALTDAHGKLGEYYHNLITESPYYLWSSHPHISYLVLEDEFRDDASLSSDLEASKQRL
ncbi:hypothetical protein CVT26_012859, partial [Gymnopilus dilepis]